MMPMGSSLSETPAAVSEGGADGGSDSSGCNEFMLFGVRVKVDSMRKCVSMNNLSEYQTAANTIPGDGFPKASNSTAGYTSADDVGAPQPTSGSRKRGLPWTEEEHRLFLIGLQNVGKGDWRGISRNYVKTRTPTQVASHAQKYFIRQTNFNRRRRRSSLFDMTTDSIAPMPAQEHPPRNHHQDNAATSYDPNGFPIMPFPIHLPSMQHVSMVENSATGESIVNHSSSTFYPGALNLNGNYQLVPLEPSLALSLSLSPMPVQPSITDSSLRGDKVISVA